MLLQVANRVSLPLYHGIHISTLPTAVGGNRQVCHFEWVGTDKFATLSGWEQASLPL